MMAKVKKPEYILYEILKKSRHTKQKFGHILNIFLGTK